MKKEIPVILCRRAYSSNKEAVVKEAVVYPAHSSRGIFYSWGLDYESDGGTFTAVLVSFPETGDIIPFHPNSVQFPEGFPPPPEFPIHVGEEG